MRYSDVLTEVGYRLAAAGYADQEVGVRSEEGEGAMWQGLVRLNRTNLIRSGIGDKHLWVAVRPGHDRLAWLVEDEPGHVIMHRSEDCDATGYRERIDDLVSAFDKVTAHYGETPEPVDFGQY